MTREEEIRIAADNFCEHTYCKLGECADFSFTRGAEWADKHPKSPWINVKDDLPYKFPELIVCKTSTKHVIVKTKTGYDLDFMVFEDGEWNWNFYEVEYWMPIPELNLQK